MEITPKKGFAGLIENWQSDLLAAVSVALVALPLALGIAVASDVPPMAGLLSSIIGGIVTTFIRGSNVGINGPTAGLIAVVLSSLAALEDGSGQTLNYVLAAFVFSGLIQVVMGALKLGIYAEVFPNSVIHGLLAAIGVIIFGKQLPIAFDIDTTSIGALATITEVFVNIGDLNPFVTIISSIGLFILVYHAKLSYKIFQFLPAPIWVLAISMPFVYLFDFFKSHELSFLGKSHEIGPHLLVQIPENLLDSIMFPNFSRIGEPVFWISVISITVIATIETLASTKAVDKLDPYKRKTDLNKDLVGVGLSTMLSGFLGGLPIITVIVRSTVNLHNNAKTKWSNFYHGLLLLLFIFFLANIIQLIPLGALAIILVFTGFKLASPKIFKRVHSYGLEQSIFFVSTFLITLFTNLLMGLFGGMLITLITHFLLSRLPLTIFLNKAFNPQNNVLQKDDGSIYIKIKGIANFINIIKLNKLLLNIPQKVVVNVDLSEVVLIDHNNIETLYEYKKVHESNGGKFIINGLDKHVSSSNHEMSLKFINKPSIRLNARQMSLITIANNHNCSFRTNSNIELESLEDFYFFKTRTILKKGNCIFDISPNSLINWEVADIVFGEGAMLSSEIHNTTIGIINLPYSIPKFTVEKRGILEKYIVPINFKNIDYVLYEDLFEDLLVKVESKEKMDKFLNDELISLFNKQDIHHFESNGKSLLIFNNQLHLAEKDEYSTIIKFIQELLIIFEKDNYLDGHNQ